MNCVACGKELADGSSFCNYCGAKQEKAEPEAEPKSEKMYCNQCHKEFDADMMFCDECGMKLSPRANDDEEPTRNGVGCLLKIELASICRGEKPMGSASFQGTIFFYPDRIEKKGMLSDKYEIFAKMEDIESVSKGSYLGLWSCVTIRLKNGEVYTMAGAAASSAIIDCAIGIIRRNIV